MFDQILNSPKHFLDRLPRGWFVILSFVLAACSAAPETGPVSESPLLRLLERKSGLIAYIGLDGNVYTIDQGGGSQTAITNDADVSESAEALHIYQFPTWSRDGDQLAFVSIVGEQGLASNTSLYTTDPQGKELVEVFQSNEELPFYLYWAPDGESISFLTSSGNVNDIILRLSSVPGGESEILDIGRPFYWAWSPDAKNMVIHVGGSFETNPRARLASLSLSLSGTLREEKLNLNPYRFQAPAWSPDGNQLLLAGQNQFGEGILYLTDLRGSPFRELATFDGNIAFNWSPDGKRIAYVATDMGGVGTLGQLSVIDPDSPLDTLTTPDEQVVAYFWSPDSKKIAYVLPVVSPIEGDGRQGGQQQQENLLLELKIMDLGGEEPRTIAVFLPTQQFISMIPFFDQYHHSATIWSPDSDNLVLSAFTQEGGPGVWVVPASGTLPPRFITPGIIAFWSWK